MDLNRRSFVGMIGGGLAAAAASTAMTADAQLVYQRTDWHNGDFDKLVKDPAKVKQVYDIRPIDEGRFLNSMKNSLNGLHFGFGVPQDQIRIVAAMHGAANMFNFDDSMWEKYQIGEWLKVTDPKTGKPATRNIYLQKTAGPATDPSDRSSIFQDTSIEALQSRGVKFLSCHTANEEQAHVLITRLSLKNPVEEIVNEFQAHTVPGVLIVPAMVASIALLQSEGHYSYITV